MRRTLCILVLATCLTNAASAQNRFNRRLPLASDGSIRIQNLAGIVRLHGWDRDSIVATGEVGRGSKGFFMGGDRNGVKLGIDIPNDDVTTAEPSTLEVWVPAGSRVRVKSTRGEIVVDGVTGALDLGSTSGNVTVTGIPRELTVETMDGDVQLDGAVVWLRARSAGGDITVRGGAEDLVSASVSGAVTVTGGPVRAARLETMTGNIVFEASIARGAVLDLGTHSGAVRVLLPKGSTPMVEATTVAAPIDNNLTPQRAQPRGDGRELALSLGGDARVTVRSFKGAVTVGWGGPPLRLVKQ
ncbi:MAG TPA: DUF4097 family beta strand repeat-containing protein [Gemmatimonadaceae bacterium]|nr:DUF4097 family beta strand repeat-containing protein [Gemmatimonadaceae bacterium]